MSKDPLDLDGVIAIHGNRLMGIFDSEDQFKEIIVDDESHPAHMFYSLVICCEPVRFLKIGPNNQMYDYRTVVQRILAQRDKEADTQ